MHGRLRDWIAACRTAAILALLVLCASATRAADLAKPTAEGLAFFEAKIRPVLVEKCYACHSQKAKKLQGNLLVDGREGLLEGGDTGPAIVPGKPEESLLLEALRYESYEMPPSGKLPDAVIADFEKWIAMGAPDPRAGSAPVAATTIDLEKGRKFWCFQPVKHFAPPEVKHADWPLKPIDQFLLAKLEGKGLEPAADTDHATWLRRVTFDLIGLPPSIEELDAFVGDESADACEKVVDRLLASPHFGERWGRHWLDVARFAESSGGGRTLLFKDAWRYRDYVLNSVNEDKPFDRFIIEQIAGDLLPHATPEEEREHLIATGYLILGAHNYEEQDKAALEMDVVDEQLDTIGRGLLGMTIGCARCHDHKFDPIPTSDYYALAGILRSTHVLIHENVSMWMTRPLPMKNDEREAMAAFEKKVAQLKQKVAAVKAENASDKDKRKLAALQKQLKTLEALSPTPVAMAVEDGKEIADCQICIRGSVHHRGPAVPRGMLQVATVGEPPQLPGDHSGRLELAQWLASPRNPLTARVYVNRVWGYLFGVGLVRTLDNFGTTGQQPSHPELLDYLAEQFVQNGWSTKRLVRELVLSRAYRMGADTSDAAAAVDPENRLLWRMNRKRMDAESLRDAMLMAGGRLDLKYGGPNMTKEVLQKVSAIVPAEYGYEFKGTRRSVYTPAFRNRMHELFEAFDFADQNRTVSQRNVTTVAPQALFMLNSPFVMEQAKTAAKRMLSVDDMTDDERIVRAFRETLGRAPSRRELTMARWAIHPAKDNGANAESAKLAGWEQLYQALFGCVDFRYLD